MKIRLSVNDKTLIAKLVDSATTRDIVELLPLTIPMNDLFRREKFGHLPRAISSDGKHTRSYALGFVTTKPDLSSFYDLDPLNAVLTAQGLPTVSAS